MIPATWNAPDIKDDDPSTPGRPLPTLVSLHFLRSALRRRWVACVLSAVLGLLAAVAFFVAFPASQSATAMLVLTHGARVDPSGPLATDVNLLTSRTVSARTTAKLGLAMTPDDFLGSMTAEPVSSELLSITITAPTEEEAVQRLEVLTSTYLEFRTQQLSIQSNILVDGMTQRIGELQDEVEALTQRIDSLSAVGESGSSELTDALAQRTKVTGQIDTLQQSVQDAILQNTSIVSSSRVIDSAAAEPGGAKRRIVLTLASGLIGGAALGCGVVLFLAITSNRLRRRFDVAAALAVAVPVSVGRIAPLPSRLLWLPHVRSLNARRNDERMRLAHAIEMELPLPGRFGRLVVACIDNAEEVRFAVASAALELAARGNGVVLLDLSEHGGLDDAVAELTTDETADRPTVLRPRGVPALAVGPADLVAVGPADLVAVGHEDEEDDPLSSDMCDISLVMADLDPSVGADYLTTWTDRVVIVVTAGLSSAERVRTAGEIVRAAELDLRFAALLRTDVTDESSGTTGFYRPGPIHVRAGNGLVEARTRDPGAGNGLVEARTQEPERR